MPGTRWTRIYKMRTVLIWRTIRRNIQRRVSLRNSEIPHRPRRNIWLKMTCSPERLPLQTSLSSRSGEMRARGRTGIFWLAHILKWGLFVLILLLVGKSLAHQFAMIDWRAVHFRVWPVVGAALAWAHAAGINEFMPAPDFNGGGIMPQGPARPASEPDSGRRKPQKCPPPGPGG